jgi:integrase/recombinase XerD
LDRVGPSDVGKYLQGLKLAVLAKKLHLAALRRFFDRLVVRHICVINPAATVRTERHAMIDRYVRDDASSGRCILLQHSD